MKVSAETCVVVVGASGFIGSHVLAAFRERGINAVGQSAPRITTRERSAKGVAASVEGDMLESWCELLGSVSHVMNAAGLAGATSGDADRLVGANAAVPALLARACERTATRLLHISSAAVQGRRVLDQTPAHDPFSPYSLSKSLGERVLGEVGGDARILRPTSVHGPGRSVTQSLIRFARSPLATVAASGTAHTPQVHVRNVAEAAIEADASGRPPSYCPATFRGVDNDRGPRSAGKRTVTAYCASARRDADDRRSSACAWWTCDRMGSPTRDGLVRARARAVFTGRQGDTRGRPCRLEDARDVREAHMTSKALALATVTKSLAFQAPGAWSELRRRGYELTFAAATDVHAEALAGIGMVRPVSLSRVAPAKSLAALKDLAGLVRDDFPVHPTPDASGG